MVDKCDKDVVTSAFPLAMAGWIWGECAIWSYRDEESRPRGDIISYCFDGEDEEGAWRDAALRLTKTAGQ